MALSDTKKNTRIKKSHMKTQNQLYHLIFSSTGRFGRISCYVPLSHFQAKGYFSPNWGLLLTNRTSPTVTSSVGCPIIRLTPTKGRVCCCIYSNGRIQPTPLGGLHRETSTGMALALSNIRLSESALHCCSKYLGELKEDWGIEDIQRRRTILKAIDEARVGQRFRSF